MYRRPWAGAANLKPENALKRAEELLGVGQKQNALQALHDCITNRRQQRNWTKPLEEVRTGAGRQMALPKTAAAAAERTAAAPAPHAVAPAWQGSLMADVTNSS